MAKRGPVSRQHPDRIIRSGWWGTAALAIVAGAACAGTQVPPLAPAPLPASEAARDDALTRFGELLFDAIARGSVGELPFDDVALRALLGSGAAERAAAARLNTADSLGPAPAERAAFAGARYTGLCVQQGRVEPAGGALGLSRPGFVFERALVVAAHPEGGRVAAWVEGEFLFSSRGFGAVTVRRVEAPRRDHSDLELAVCELAVGLSGPQSLVGPGPVGH